MVGEGRRVKKFLPSSQAKIKWMNDISDWAWVSTIAFSFMQMNSLMVCLYTIINPWLFTMNSVSTPISQAYDSLAIVKMSHPEKNHFFQKMFIFSSFEHDLEINDVGPSKTFICLQIWVLQINSSSLKHHVLKINVRLSRLWLL